VARSGRGRAQLRLRLRLPARAQANIRLRAWLCRVARRPAHRPRPDASVAVLRHALLRLSPVRAPRAAVKAARLRAWTPRRKVHPLPPLVVPWVGARRSGPRKPLRLALPVRMPSRRADPGWTFPSYRPRLSRPRRKLPFARAQLDWLSVSNSNSNCNNSNSSSNNSSSNSAMHAPRLPRARMIPGAATGRWLRGGVCPSRADTIASESGRRRRTLMMGLLMRSWVSRAPLRPIWRVLPTADAAVAVVDARRLIGTRLARGGRASTSLRRNSLRCLRRCPSPLRLT